MPASSKSARKATSHVAGAALSQRLNPAMACDTAFRIIARHCLEDLAANQPATCQTDAAALHRMRIALTRLRTAIVFFSPVVADPEREQIRCELKWLNSHLGGVRDLDVAVERLAAAGRSQRSALERQAQDHHLRLARTLNSARYRRLIDSTLTWAENGSWSTTRDKRAARIRALPIAAYSADKLARWQRKLIKKSDKLSRMDAKQRHRLRLKTKKLSYSVEFFEGLFPGKIHSRQELALKNLRRAQKSLGQLNDDARGQSIATTAGTSLRLPPKRRKRLIKATAKAYRKLATQKPAFRRQPKGIPVEDAQLSH
jgi:CHAD domain-containing protein